jgi:D-aminoacyl-tRNA deacylase
MRLVIQRVKNASVSISGKLFSKINNGLLILVGIASDDSLEDIIWISKKIIGLRIFSDEEGKMNLDIKSINGEILLVSQFTLHASTKKGNRPSFIKAAIPEIAVPLYQQLIESLEKELGKEIGRGEFGADMQVELVNDGPVTIIIDSKNKE